jgi:photosystem II stability/assembly factor-like uncharacterized protein
MRPVHAIAIVSALSVALACAADALTWIRVQDVPATDVMCVQRYGSTLFAATTNVVYVGADSGSTWTPTSPVSATPAGIECVVPAGGALWAGTYGNGVFRSTDDGDTWQAVDTGLVGLGATYVIDLVEKDGWLYAGTGGAGAFALDLATPTQWTAFTAGYPVDTAGGINAFVLQGTTLVAAAGGNGFVYRFPSGASVWQEVAIVPPILPGLVATDLASNGDHLFVGASSRVYRSSDDALTWTLANTGLQGGSEVFLAATSTVAFAGLDYLGNNHRLYTSHDLGATWQQIDQITGVYLYGLEIAGDKLFAARTDGLWWTSLATTPVQRPTWGGLKAKFR